jgi:hypothetical protein
VSVSVASITSLAGTVYGILLCSGWPCVLPPASVGTAVSPVVGRLEWLDDACAGAELLINWHLRQ